MNAMCVLIRRIHLPRTILCGLVVCGCAFASAAAQARGVGDLGALGKTYSFSMDLGPEDNTAGHAFTASNAVQHATLTRTSGGSFMADVPGGARGLVIGTDHSERGLGYVYRAHGPVERTALVSDSGHPSNNASTLDGAYGYMRDTVNNLWWAVPHHQRHD